MMASASGIKNEEALIDIFGYFPSFHDAEVLSIYLDRGGEDGPYLEAKIHVFAGTSRIDAEGHYVSENHTLVTFRFTRIVMGLIKWFNHQNVIDGVEVEEVEPENNHGRRLIVRLPSLHGCEASFSCQEALITDARPYDPAA